MASLRNSLLVLSLMVLFGACSDQKDDDLPSPPPQETVSDIDGNVYHTVKIGKQTWLVENLRSTRYRNGDTIPFSSGYTTWHNIITGAYGYYENDTNYASVYGFLYNWFAAADERNIAPEGYRVPTETDWNYLIDYLGGADVAGGKLKEYGLQHWASPNTMGSNSTGFTALPGGFRLPVDGFVEIKQIASFWSATQTVFLQKAVCYSLFYNFASIEPGPLTDMNYGMSIRCLKDD